MPYPNITITTQTGLSFITGEFVQLIHNSNTYIFGQVVSYDSLTGSMTITPTKVVGEAGDYCGWQVIASGSPGLDAGETASLCGIAGGVVHTLDTTVDKFSVQSVVYDYVINNSTLFESGTLTSVWNPFANQISYSQTAVSLGGSTNNIIFTFSISGNNVLLNVDLTAFPSTPLWNVTVIKTTLAGCTLYTSGAFITAEDAFQITTELSELLITE